MPKQSHHMNPISLWWPNIPENIMELDKHVHEDLHRTLNLPVKMYWRRTRKYKERNNQSLVMRPEDVQSIWDIQKEFLHNLHRLPKRLQQLHVKKMMQLVDRQRADYFRITKNAYDKPKHKTNTKDLVMSLHDLYTNCRKDCAKEIINTLKASGNI